MKSPKTTVPSLKDKFRSSKSKRDFFQWQKINHILKGSRSKKAYSMNTDRASWACQPFMLKLHSSSLFSSIKKMSFHIPTKSSATDSIYHTPTQSKACRFHLWSTQFSLKSRGSLQHVCNVKGTLIQDKGYHFACLFWEMLLPAE